MLFRRIVLYAVVVGAVSGLLLTAVQFWQVIPIIQSAERFEGGSIPLVAHDHAGHSHGATSTGHDHGASGESAPGWTAQETKRHSLTLASNMLIAMGLALIMLPLMVAALRKSSASRMNWRHGILWGAAGYGVFYLMPALGLPPEIPGTVAAPLDARQSWWLLTVVFTAAGLASLAFGNSPWRWAGLGLVAVPHLVGAPNPSTAPFAGYPPELALELEELTRQFFAATAVANAVLWLALGLAAIWALGRVVKSSSDIRAQTTVGGRP